MFSLFRMGTIFIIIICIRVCFDLFSGEIEVTEEACEDLLMAADMLSITEVVSVCCEFLWTKLQPENCIGIRIVQLCIRKIYFVQKQTYQQGCSYSYIVCTQHFVIFQLKPISYVDMDFSQYFYLQIKFKPCRILLISSG